MLTQTLRLLPWLGVLLITACVTINIYFPAAAAEDAADQLIEEIQGDGDSAPAISQTGHGRLILENLVAGLLSMLVSDARAGEADLSIDSPRIRQLSASMKARFAQLKGYLDKGYIGIGADGMLRMRDGAAVPLKDRNPAKKLLQAENQDRQALYNAIAEANGHREWAAQIKSTFATRWVKNAFSGWWYQDASGRWVQK